MLVKLDVKECQGRTKSLTGKPGEVDCWRTAKYACTACGKYLCHLCGPGHDEKCEMRLTLKKPKEGKGDE